MAGAIDILLVEDNPDDLTLVLRALQRHNLADRVVVARDGPEALDFVFCTGAYAHRCIDDRPRVILLDLKLPKLSGLEVLQRLKADPRTQSIPVVILTASTHERDIVQSYQLGANSYIVRPFDASELGEALQRIGRYWLGLNRPPRR